MISGKKIRLLAAGLALAFWAGPSRAAPAAGNPVRAELISENAAVRAGEPFWIGVRLVMEKPWHTYWLNPGDGGLATRIEWSLPPGFSAGPVQWPYPGRFGGDIVNYGYQGEVTLLSEITPPARIESTQVPISAKVEWLGCHKICVAGRAELAVVLPVVPDAPPKNARAAKFFARARAKLPREAEGWEFRPVRREKDIELFLKPPREWKGLAEAYFYPAAENVLDYAAPQILEKTGEGYVLKLKGSEVSGAGGAPPRLEGVLVSRERPKSDRRAFQVKASVS